MLQTGLRRLVFQKFLNRFAVKDRVADRGHDRSVAEIALDRASVVAVVASLKPVSVVQHEKDAQWGILAIAGLCSGRARQRSYVHPLLHVGPMR